MGQLAGLFALNQGPETIRSIVAQEAAAQGVDPVLVLAVIQQESGFSPTATHTDRDGKKSYGLMQLRWDTATGLAQGAGVALTSSQQLFDPVLNVKLGTRYLAYQLGRYGNLTDAIAAYNAGSVFKTAGGYTNQAYVDAILHYMSTLGARPAAAAAPGIPEPISFEPSDGGPGFDLEAWGPVIGAVLGGLGLLLLLRRQSR